LFPFARQHQPPVDAIEQLKAELLFQVRNLARKRGLRDAKVLSGFRDSAGFSDSDKGAGVPNIHKSILYRDGIGS
jgi:hypothetical protein